MPIVKILPDGKVRIVNTKSGEVKDVLPEELKNYAPRLVADYQALITAGEVSKAGEKPVTNDLLQLALQAQKVNEPGYDPTKIPQTPEQQQVAKEAFAIFDPMKKAYNLELPSGQRPVPEQQDLARGKEGQWKEIENIKAGFNIMFNKDTMNATQYKKMRTGMVSALKSFAGHAAGILTGEEIKMIQDLIPSFGDTDETAKANWQMIDDILTRKFGSAGQYNYLQPTKSPIAPALQQILSPKSKFTIEEVK
jgi:hypothetical protein